MHVDITGAVIGDVPIFDDELYPASAISEEDTGSCWLLRRAMCASLL